MLIDYFNIRTIFALVVSLIACFISVHYGLSIDINLVLFGLAIAFPLGTSIQTAFKRRDRALEYLGLFQSGMLAIHYSIRSSKKLDASKKAESVKILTLAADRLYHHLQSAMGDEIFNFKTEADVLMEFMEQNREFISARTLTRVIRYLKDAIDGATYLVSLTRHRTIQGLRFYSLFFIHVYIILHAPILVSNLGDVVPTWAIYAASTFSALILITLYNFQALIEYPFHQKGVDNVKLGDFKLNI